MIQDLIQKAKEALTRKKTDYEAEEAQLKAEERILAHLAVLEEKLESGKDALRQFEEIFGEFCGPQDIGGWFAGNIDKTPGTGVAVFAGLCVQIAAHDTGVTHKKEIVEGCRKMWVGGPEAELADYRKRNAAVIRKYATAA